MVGTGGPSEATLWRTVYTAITVSRPSSPFILSAMRSVLEQSVPPERILVVVNDGLLESGNVSSDLGRVFSQIEVKWIPESGMVPAITHALDLCNSEYIAFLDSDDLWLQDKQEKQLKLLHTNSEIDAVYGGVQNFTQRDSLVIKSSRVLAARLFSATTFHRRAFEKNGAPKVGDSHFNWLYRWWNSAANSGVTSAGHNETVLLRRVHAQNDWVTKGEVGRKALFQELRDIANQP
jgi:glycosyltransferase involved in cell wall biosynthesis